MEGIGRVVAESGALTATALAVGAAIPQLHRIVVGRDRLGVSITSAALGVGTEAAWFAYAVRGALWSAVPEAVLMAAANVALVVVLVRGGVVARPAWRAGMMWAATLGAIGFACGLPALAAALAAGYAVQVAPAVWTAWTTPAPTGVAAVTWVIIGLEGALWGLYGAHHADPATSGFAVVAVLAATAMLSRKALVARRLAR